MRAAEPLDGRIRAPAGLQKIVPPPFLVLRRLRRMVGSARPARIGEDQDILLTIHKGLGLGGIAAGAALFDEEMTIRGLEGPVGPPRDLGDSLVAKSPEDLIERRGDRGERHQLHHGRIAQGERLARDNERAGLIPQGFRHHVAVNLHELLRMNREGLFEVSQDVVARR